LARGGRDTFVWSLDTVKGVLGTSVAVFGWIVGVKIWRIGLKKTLESMIDLGQTLQAIGALAVATLLWNVLAAPARMAREAEAQRKTEGDSAQAMISELTAKGAQPTVAAELVALHDEIATLVGNALMACDQVKVRVFADAYQPMWEALKALRAFMETKRHRLHPAALKAIHEFDSIAGHAAQRFSQMGLDPGTSNPAYFRRSQRELKYCFRLSAQARAARDRALSVLNAVERGEVPIATTFRRLVVTATGAPSEKFLGMTNERGTYYMAIAQIDVENVSPESIKGLQVRLMSGEPTEHRPFAFEHLPMPLRENSDTPDQSGRYRQAFIPQCIREASVRCCVSSDRRRRADILHAVLRRAAGAHATKHHHARRWISGRPRKAACASRVYFEHFGERRKHRHRVAALPAHNRRRRPNDPR
jgi:hypothetical protein